jgi:hypothetical protein
VWVLECQTIEALAARLADAGAVAALSALPPLTATVSQQDGDSFRHALLTYEQVSLPERVCSADHYRLSTLIFTNSLCAAAMQEQFYQLWENAPDSSAYNSGFYLCLEGNLGLDVLQAAVRMLFERQQVGRPQACIIPLVLLSSAHHHLVTQIHTAQQVCQTS